MKLYLQNQAQVQINKTIATYLHFFFNPQKSEFLPFLAFLSGSNLDLFAAGRQELGAQPPGEDEHLVGATISNDFGGTC